jgi:hypothetical protein
MDVGNDADVSEIHASSIFRDGLCRMGEFVCIEYVCLNKHDGEVGGLLVLPVQCPCKSHLSLSTFHLVYCPH